MAELGIFEIVIMAIIAILVIIFFYYVPFMLWVNAVVLGDLTKGEILVVVEVVELFLALGEDVAVKIKQHCHAVSLIFHIFGLLELQFVKRRNFTSDILTQTRLFVKSKSFTFFQSCFVWFYI